MSIFAPNKTFLFPYKRENISGITPSSSQFYGWEIVKFQIDNCWINSQGEGIKVAVLDTGCDLDHPDLQQNLLDGKNFIQKNEPPLDKNGHGTHVAGTIAAINNGLGMVGVAPKAKILPVKVLGDDGTGNVDKVSEGIKWASEQKVDFITMSLGTTFPDRKLKKAIDYAEKNGTICFCAAGNYGMKKDILYPAKYDNVIAIGAINEFFNRTDFTCAGDALDFLAPGTNIISCVPDNAYASMSGTSMSNPFATGCAALLCSWNKKNKKYSLKNTTNYIDVFAKNSLKIRDERYQDKKYQGNGIIDIRNIFR